MTFSTMFYYSTLLCDVEIHSGTMKEGKESLVVVLVVVVVVVVVVVSTSTINGPRLMTQQGRRNNCFYSTSLAVGR